MKANKSRITKKIHQRLLTCVIAAFTLSTIISYMTNTRTSRASTHELLMTNIDDIRQYVNEEDSSCLTRALLFYRDYYDTCQSFQPTKEFIADLKENAILINEKADKLQVELSIIDENGIIAASSRPEYIGYNMDSADQSREFLVLLKNPKVKLYLQKLTAQGLDAKKMRYVAASFTHQKGFVQMGLDEQNYHQYIKDYLNNLTRYRRIGKNGSMYVFDNRFDIISAPKTSNLTEIKKGGIKKKDILAHKPETMFETSINGVSSYCMYNLEKEFIILATQPISEATLTRNTSVYMSAINVFAVFLILFFVISLLTKRLVVKNIDKVNGSLAKITDGNLDEVVNVRDSYEFDSLSTDINKTVDRLKIYIHEAETRMDADLALAKAIQLSALPSEFPAFPNNKEFDVFACMKTAKEVGGDFYDFYFSGEDKFTITIADVSGKGIPAAMFMMRGKSVMKNTISTGISLGKACNRVNNNLCQNNETNTFFTGWVGTIDLQTGLMTYVNAGHNKPLVRQNGGEFTFLPCQNGIPVGVFEGFEYTEETIQLHPGDEVFLYTDGVTEATNPEDQLFGDERLLQSLNIMPVSVAGMPQTVCQYILRNVQDFANGAEQSDDITMLCFRYIGK